MQSAGPRLGAMVEAPAALELPRLNSSMASLRGGCEDARRVFRLLGVAAIATVAMTTGVRAEVLPGLGDLPPPIPIPGGPGAPPPPDPPPPPGAEVVDGRQVPDVCTGGVLKPGGRLQRFANSLRVGETGCLRRGVYRGGVDLRTPATTLRNYPGKRPTISGGQVRISQTARGAAIEGLRLISDQFSPLIYASHARIADNEITNRHTAICLIVDRYRRHHAPRDVVIEGNRIHDCGELPANNHDHGIYIDYARDAVVRDNLIYDNADRGIQLYPSAQRTRIVGNVIDGNGEGVIFANRSDGSLVKGNIISNSTIRHNVESSGSTAKHNEVRGNCLWSSLDGYYGGEPPHSGVLPDGTGFRLGRNVIADPRFHNRIGFRPSRRSRCSRVLPAQAARR